MRTGLRSDGCRSKGVSISEIARLTTKSSRKRATRSSGSRGGKFWETNGATVTGDNTDNWERRQPGCWTAIMRIGMPSGTVLQA
jgi:hypothetical protein